MFWVAKETGEGSTLRKKIVGEEILNGISPLIPISPPISLSQPSESRQLMVMPLISYTFEPKTILY